MIKVMSGRGINTVNNKDLYVTVESKGGKSKSFKSKNAKKDNPNWNEEDVFDFDNYESAFFEVKVWADTALISKDTVVGSLTVPLKPYSFQGTNSPVEWRPLAPGPGELQIQILITTASDAEKKGWSTGAKVAVGAAAVVGVAAVVGLGAYAVHEMKDKDKDKNKAGGSGGAKPGAGAGAAGFKAPGGGGGHSAGHGSASNPAHGECYIFEHKNFGGKHHKFTKQCEDLRKIGMNDMMSAVKLGPGTKVTLYEHINFGGKSVTVDHSMAWLGDRWNDKVSSLKVHH
jgi:hypothetical protein